MRPVIAGIGGFTSNVGKTRLMCELLQRLRGWEAIKTTRGHYRSCGKDPEACCVSHLLTDEPVVRSGRAETYEANKDTGRYWDSGASNVHWVIAAAEQIEKGIHSALERVKAEGVLIEGNSFAKFVETDYFFIVARTDVTGIKSTARDVLPLATGVYLSDAGAENIILRERLLSLYEKSPVGSLLQGIPTYTVGDIPHLIETIECRAGSVLSPV